MYKNLKYIPYLFVLIGIIVTIYGMALTEDSLFEFIYLNWLSIALSSYMTAILSSTYLRLILKTEVKFGIIIPIISIMFSIAIYINIIFMSMC